MGLKELNKQTNKRFFKTLCTWQSQKTVTHDDTVFGFGVVSMIIMDDQSKIYLDSTYRWCLVIIDYNLKDSHLALL